MVVHFSGITSIAAEYHDKGSGNVKIVLKLPELKDSLAPMILLRYLCYKLHQHLFQHFPVVCRICMSMHSV